MTAVCRRMYALAQRFRFFLLLNSHIVMWIVLQAIDFRLSTAGNSIAYTTNLYQFWQQEIGALIGWVAGWRIRSRQPVSTKCNMGIESITLCGIRTINNIYSCGRQLRISISKCSHVLGCCCCTRPPDQGYRLWVTRDLRPKRKKYSRL